MNVDQGMGILPWSPLASGLLTGKYRGKDAPDSGSRFHAMGRILNPCFWWDEASSSVIVGARTTAQLESSLEVGDWDLPDEQAKLLTDQLPCPHGYPCDWIQTASAGTFNKTEDDVSRAQRFPPLGTRLLGKVVYLPELTVGGEDLEPPERPVHDEQVLVRGPPNLIDPTQYSAYPFRYVLMTAFSLHRRRGSQMKPYWVATVLVTVLLQASAGAAGVPEPHNRIDELVFARLAERGIPPSAPCSDAVFIRRVYLDMTGTLPRAGEVWAFLEDEREDKRARLVDDLFDHPAYPDYWAQQWCDLLRVKAEFPSKLWPNAVQAYHRWLRDAMRDNLPYDRFARALLTSSGSNFRVPPVNFYRAVPGRDPEGIAEAVALAFLGERTDRWDPARLEGLGTFFSMVGYKGTAEWKEEIVYFDLEKAFSNQAANAHLEGVFPDGTTAVLDLRRDPREVFADWLVADEQFAQAMANRIWFWLLGRGLVHEPDDFRPDNPASHPDVLAWLADELVQHEYDLRHVVRLILNSATYQLSCEHTPENVRDETYFSHYLPRRLDAEVLIDALNQVTGSRERYQSEIPEPFTFIPEQHRSVTLGDGSITSPFLDLFGRPPRDTGLASERNNTPADGQALHLLNSSHIQQKIERSWRLRQEVNRTRQTPRLVRRMYLDILSRPPTSEELDIASGYVEDHGGGRLEAAGDLVWALINTTEFLYRH